MIDPRMLCSTPLIHNVTGMYTCMHTHIHIYLYRPLLGRWPQWARSVYVCMCDYVQLCTTTDVYCTHSSTLVALRAQPASTRKAPKDQPKQLLREAGAHVLGVLRPSAPPRLSPLLLSCLGSLLLLLRKFGLSLVSLGSLVVSRWWLKSHWPPLFKFSENFSDHSP